jgi:prophage antirepressor-like protein
MNEVLYFIFETNVVRAVNYDMYPYFVLDDIRKIIGFEKIPEKAFVSQGWDEHFAEISIENETFTIISSNAVFRILSFFRRKKAKIFEKWLSKEVIMYFSKEFEKLYSRKRPWVNYAYIPDKYSLKNNIFISGGLYE